MRQEMKWAQYKKRIVFLYTIDNETWSTLCIQNNEKLTNAMKNWWLQLKIQLTGPQEHAWRRTTRASCALNAHPDWSTGYSGLHVGGNASSCALQLNFRRRARGGGRKALPEDRALKLSFRGWAFFVLRFLTGTHRKDLLPPRISAH